MESKLQTYTKISVLLHLQSLAPGNISSVIFTLPVLTYSSKHYLSNAALHYIAQSGFCTPRAWHTIAVVDLVAFQCC